jgi:uncharacterized membrane protein (DUF485 family)
LVEDDRLTRNEKIFAVVVGIIIAMFFAYVVVVNLLPYYLEWLANLKGS